LVLRLTVEHCLENTIWEQNLDYSYFE
ncbi:unnamed protein product, partial [Rotaria sp. Silwood2]